MGAEIAVELTTNYLFILSETQRQPHCCLCCSLTDKVVTVLLHCFHYGLDDDVQTSHLIWLVVLHQVPHCQDFHVFAELALDLDYAVHNAKDYLDIAEENRIKLLVVQPTEFLRNFHPIFQAELTLLQPLVNLLENVQSMLVSGISLEHRTLNDKLKLLIQLRNVKLVDLIINDIRKLHSDELHGLLLVLIKNLEFCAILRHDTIQEVVNKYLPTMILLVILLNPFQQFLHAFWTMPEHLPHSQRDLPDTFIGVCTERTMHVLMLVDIQILIRGVLTFVLLDAHQELVYDDFLGVLVGGDTGVDELYDLADVFGLEDVWHDVRHHLADGFEVLLLELDEGCLKELDQVALDELCIGDVFLFGVEAANEAVELGSDLADLAGEELLESVDAVALIELEVREQLQQ